ncbi:MAG: CDP-diacylglycerol---glycerol-3-phosphate 3-phosphatidyltransferase [Acidobacteriota bacterium]|jgi:phosphatidylglycerophosphate synthase|nr:CDP-diacylglycerol---glycerol-3-phosphate 3-phosphatidyltransferase [Acidobacteriota bacterium]
MSPMTSNHFEQSALKPIDTVRYVLPSAVSFLRVLLAIFLIAEIDKLPTGMLFTAFIGVPIIFTLDAVDGILARRLNSQTLLGSFIDIAADRLVEFLFLQYFIRVGLIPLWFVLVFYGRIVLTDACRVCAFRMERVPATGILLPRRWRFLVLSKLSRSAYASLKGVLFSVLLLTMYQGRMSLSILDFGILLSVLFFSLLRAVPILVTYLPRTRYIITMRLKGKRGPEVSDHATRTTKVASWMQLASDFCLATVLVTLALLH